MCGIIGYVGSKNAYDVIIDGLERLEYRGYDSAGIATFKKNKLEIIKAKGQIKNLKSKIDFENISNIGIGHTRWATHGEPNDINSHPHNVGKITLVHNGIIENYIEIKNKLINDGYKFKTNTDTEVASALLDQLYNKNSDMKESIIEFERIVKGAYALAILNSDITDKIYVIKKESPLIIGIGEKDNYIASDVPAILKYTRRYIPLLDGDFAIIDKQNISIFDFDGNKVERQSKLFEGDSNDVSMNGYEHYMLKEIHEESSIFKNITCSLLNDMDKYFDSLPDINKYKRIDIVACGSAMHAGLVGKQLIEKYGNIPVNVEIASEYRYKKLFLDKDILVILVSQSGETADTLAALKIAKEHNAHTLGIINVVESTIARNADEVIYTKAGCEIAVATTKAYLAQVTIFALLALKLCYKNIDMDDIINSIKLIPTYIEELTNRDYKDLAKILYKHNDTFFIGRGIDYALSMEGSLKLKEISYINSQAYAAGELKHGTISLINDGTPVIGIITDKDIACKTISNIKETKSRGANVTILVTSQLDDNDKYYDNKIVVPTVNDIFQPILSIIPLQMLSYEIAKLRGCEIDKPKNLAKSVTVE